jgi:hypothetical protein
MGDGYFIYDEFNLDGVLHYLVARRQDDKDRATMHGCMFFNPSNEPAWSEMKVDARVYTTRESAIAQISLLQSLDK